MNKYMNQVRNGGGGQQDLFDLLQRSGTDQQYSQQGHCIGVHDSICFLCCL
jgi:hypothetical protein